MKVLLVEDDTKAAASLRRGLHEEGFVVDVAPDGFTGLELALAGACDLMILDVSLPGMNGFEILEAVRKQSNAPPIIMLTARDGLDDRVRCLSAGADDYVIKPFAFSELTARVRAVLRRGETRTDSKIVFEDLTMDVARNQVRRGDAPVELTQRELQLLQLFVRHADEILSRTYIAERVWEMSFDGDSNIVDVSVSRLRTKIDGPFQRKFIQTVRGRGYVFR